MLRNLQPLTIALLITTGVMVLEIVVGLLSRSLALLEIRDTYLIRLTQGRHS